jgi:serine/threonine protein kinase
VPDEFGPEFVALQQAVAGRYSLERELGRGGMGIVYLARDVALDRPVAIKLLPPALGAKPGLRERFLQEARTAAKLSHPNIVGIHSVEEAAGLVFFVMTFVDGETLGERLRLRGALTPHDAARMIQEVAWALGYAHGRGVVHRDVKPDNVMLERASGRAIVMDFGIAGAAGGAAEAFGTAQYVSPEQAAAEPIDGRSDLYSLGVVAFLALTGQLPFDAPDAQGFLAMHVSKPAPGVLSVSPGLPRKLAQAVDRCLAKAPADRFPDGESLAESVTVALEPKRQLPVPVRLWLTKGEENRMTFVLWYTLAGPPFGAAIGAMSHFLLHVPTTLAVIVGIKAYALTPILLHGTQRWWRLRKLLGQGYSIEDARVAVRNLVEQRREELTWEYGAEPPWWAKLTRLTMHASGWTLLGVFARIVTMHGTPGMGLAVASLAASGTLLISAGVQAVRPGKKITRDAMAEWRLKFWNSRYGKWFEKLARIGLKKRALPAELTYRPTEMAIGLAADALFESLPKEQRRELKDLPAVLERLQLDAALMRKTVDDLNGALAGLGDQNDASRSSALAGDAARAGLEGTRAKLRGDLTTKRDEAARRLASAVASLETVRLSLLRLKAGTGTVSELTADLSAARSLTEDLDAARALTAGIDRATESHAEVSALLKPSGA